MTRVKPITAKLLRSEARRELLSCIIEGRLEPGKRIKAVTLAKELGVSRTPLREALVGLELDGYVSRHGLRSFYVKRLDPRDIEEICVILGSLEGLAVSTCGLPKPEMVSKLEDLTDRMSRTEDIQESLRLDFAWHALLLRACPNRHLQSSIFDLRQKLRRYEIAFTKETGRPAPTAIKNKLSFLYSCKMGNIDDAARWMKEIWLVRIRPLTVWLRDRESRRPVTPWTDGSPTAVPQETR